MIIDGFGYTDAMDVKLEPDKTDWLIEGLLPRGLGFIAGPPKAGNSPYGGKSIFLRALAYSLGTGYPFLGRSVLHSGPSLLLNLDEPPWEQAKQIRQLSQGQEVRGIHISKALTAVFPEDIGRLTTDIHEVKPVIVGIDPLIRCSAGRDLKEARDTVPMTNAFKRLQLHYNLCLPISHHSIKNPKRDKENTASWLSGSTDLDSVWDFCFCLEWDAKKKAIHLRAFYRHHARQDLYYRAEFNDNKEIIGLEVMDRAGIDQTSREVLQYLHTSENHAATVAELVEATGRSRVTIWRRLKDMNGRLVQPAGSVDGAQAWTAINGYEAALSGVTDNVETSIRGSVSSDSETHKRTRKQRRKSLKNNDIGVTEPSETV